MNPHRQSGMPGGQASHSFRAAEEAPPAWLGSPGGRRALIAAEGAFEARRPLYVSETIDHLRLALALAKTPWEANEIARRAIGLAALEFALGTDDGDCGGQHLQRSAAESLGRAIDLCRTAEEALSIARFACAAGRFFAPHSAAAFRAAHRLGAERRTPPQFAEG